MLQVTRAQTVLLLKKPRSSIFVGLCSVWTDKLCITSWTREGRIMSAASLSLVIIGSVRVISLCTSLYSHPSLHQMPLLLIAQFKSGQLKWKQIPNQKAWTVRQEHCVVTWAPQCRNLLVYILHDYKNQTMRYSLVTHMQVIKKISSLKFD